MGPGTKTIDAIAQESLTRIAARGTLRSLRRLSDVRGSRVRVDGREVLLFAGSNYLGLSNHPEVVEAAQKAIRDWGCAAGGSRLISGNLELHEELEEQLARFTGCEAALVFNSGYAANLGIIPALVGHEDVVISDALNHASIIDGTRLSGAAVEVFPHSDLEALDRVLLEAWKSGRRRLLVIDGVFSMDGDLAPLPEILQLAEQHDAMVLLDDAHGTATLGPDGRGTAAHFDCADRVDIQLGNLAKGFGSFGAFVAGSRSLRELLINVARSFIFTCALPPAQVAASIAALRVALAEPWRREALQRNAGRLRERLEAGGVSTSPSTSHIVPVVIGENAATMSICEALMARGFYVQGIRHPSVAHGSARLRITPIATHEEAEVDALADAIVELATPHLEALAT